VSSPHSKARSLPTAGRIDGVAEPLRVGNGPRLQAVSAVRASIRAVGDVRSVEPDVGPVGRRHERMISEEVMDTQGGTMSLRHVEDVVVEPPTSPRPKP
jgi:hypothetical protein